MHTYTRIGTYVGAVNFIENKLDFALHVVLKVNFKLFPYIK